MFGQISLKRKIIYSIAFFLFGASSLVITFFAFGYRFNLQNGIFIYSGTITIKSTPREVEIYLNGKATPKKSYDLINGSYNLNGIKPGTYSLEIKAPGYSAWQKQISVHSGVATEFWNIVLTEDEPQKTRLEIPDPSFYKIAENGEKIVYANRSSGPLSIFLYSQKQEAPLKIFEEPSNRKHTADLELAEFSPDGENLLFAIKENEISYYYLALLRKIEEEGLSQSSLIYLNSQLDRAADLYFNQYKAKQEEKETEKSVPASLPEELAYPIELVEQTNASSSSAINFGEAQIPTNLHSFKWLDNDNLYFQNLDVLFSLTLSKEEIKPIFEKIKGYNISQGSLFFVRAPNNLVFRSERNGTNIKQITENLIDQDFDNQNYNPAYKIIVYDEKRLILINHNKELYLYNDNDGERQIFKKIGEDIQGTQFSDDGKKLLYFTDSAIKVYYLKEWEVQPKNQVGANITLFLNKKERIHNAIWHKSYQNILFSTEGTVKLIELDTRNQINQAIALKTQLSNPQFSYDTQSNTLFFLDLFEQQAWLHSLELPKR